MKTFLVAVAAAAAVAALAGQASAAGSPEERIAALERQVATLAARPQATPADRRIAALEKRVKTLETNLKKAQTALNQTRGLAAFGVAYSVCLTAFTADALSGTWSVIDQIATTAQAKTYFVPQAAVADAETCKALEIARAPAVPPTVAPFSALTALLS